MRTYPRLKDTTRRGTVLVLVALSLLVLLGAAALSVDAGRMYHERRNAQTAADAAAEAAGIELYEKYRTYGGLDRDGQAKAAALAIAAAHGYEESQVTVNIPPKSGPLTGKPGYAEVLIAAGLPRTFSNVLGSGDLDVQARAVAAGASTPTKASVIVLGPKKKTFRLKGQYSSLETTGDIIVNSSDKKAVTASKRSQIVGERLLVTGGVDRKAKELIEAEVHTGVEPTPDPLADLPVPPKGPARTVEESGAKGKKPKGKSSEPTVYRLQPGHYKELRFDGDDMVYMEPGIYHVEGRVEFRGNSSLEAHEVMIYNDSKKGFKFQTTGDVTITPPTSGTYEGISLFQNRTAKAKIEFRKAGHLAIEGAVYGANSQVRFRASGAELSGWTGDDDDEDEEDEDWEEDDEDEDDLGDDGPAGDSSIGAAIVSRALRIEKGSRVQVQGASLDAMRPLRGLLE